MLWSARTVVEKIKTDQRSHALEMLCLAIFWRGSDEYRLVDRALWPPLKKSFESNFGANWHPKPTNARMVRLMYYNSGQSICIIRQVLLRASSLTLEQTGSRSRRMRAWCGQSDCTPTD
jgi:hypothetical protein